MLVWWGWSTSSTCAGHCWISALRGHQTSTPPDSSEQLRIRVPEPCKPQDEVTLLAAACRSGVRSARLRRSCWNLYRPCRLGLCARHATGFSVMTVELVSGLVLRSLGALRAVLHALRSLLRTCWSCVVVTPGLRAAARE